MGLMGEIFYLVQQQQTGASQLNKGIRRSHISIEIRANIRYLMRVRQGRIPCSKKQIHNITCTNTVRFGLPDFETEANRASWSTSRGCHSLADLVAMVQDNFSFWPHVSPSSSCTGSKAGQYPVSLYFLYGIKVIKETEDDQSSGADCLGPVQHG